MELILYSIFLIVVGNLVYLYYKRYRELSNLKEINFELLKNNDEIKRTLAYGLYYRFSNIKVDDNNSSEVTEASSDFEDFVAKVMENYYGGTTYVRGGSRDFGVDIEHERENDEIYLGQVKCYNPDKPIPFEPIALIHSNMVKENTKGGFIVTTSGFTENAKKYNNTLNIELIDGIKLVDYWVNGLEKQMEHVLALKAERGIEVKPSN